MPSRKKRKRYRQRAEATARAKPRGGWGQGLPISRSDLVLLRKAINADWPVADEVRPLIVDDVCQMFDHDKNRYALAAIRTVLAMEAANIRQERREAIGHNLARKKEAGSC